MEKLDPATCARYVEFLIAERHEESALFHNRLAELYLNMAMTAKRRGDQGSSRHCLPHLRVIRLIGRLGTRKVMKEKLLDFLDTTHHYETARLFGLLPSDGKGPLAVVDYAY